MVLKIPQNHNFPDSLIKKVFEETGCQSLPDWEISVRRTDDIAWSVVLSYLMSTNYHKEQDKKQEQNEDQTQDDFARRLKRLTGGERNVKSVKKSIRSFNPFRNRSSCFYDETLRQVVKEFKRNISWNNLNRISDKLLAASTTLRCPIVSIWKDENSTKSRIYAKNTEKCEEIIALYSCDIAGEENEKTETVQNFFLNHQLGLKMKNAALLYFLKEAKMSVKEMRRIELTVKSGKHFLISLLNSDCQEIIPKLYKSAYVVSKLAEAGFETDPRTRDAEGFSALYHALVLGDVKTLYVLYYFAANNCFRSEGSYRNPDCCILNNLSQMEEILKADFAKSEDFRHHPDHNDLKRTSDDLLRFNRFLIEIINKIIKIKSKINYYESTDETEFEACKRRDIVVSVLDTYQEFFKPVQQESANLTPLDDYVMFENYYSSIDMATAIIFFDNIIFLKERLILADETQFSAMESSFFLSVWYHVEFDEENIPHNFCHSSIQINRNSLYIFPLIRRLENMNKIKEFSKNLQDTVINKDNVVNRIPTSEIYSIFKSYPSIKDGFHLERLKKYIKTALNVKVRDVKSVLIIERVLQVIGEYITLEDNNDYSFRRFFSLILPKEVSRTLRHTRNELSHVKSYVFKPKAECEATFSLFRSIQREIRAIQYYFKPVFQTQNLSGSLAFIKMFEEQLEQIRKSAHLYNSSSLDPTYLREEISTLLISTRHILIRRYHSSCKELLKIVFCSVKNDILNEINWSGDTENLKNKILYALWPIKWLLELLQQCGEHKVVTVLDVFETLKNCDQNIGAINDLRDMTRNFLDKCKDLISKFIPPRQKKVIKPLKLSGNIEHFLKILKGFVYLSNEEINEIRKEIPETIKQSITLKEKLAKSIDDGFSLNVDDKAPEFKISYLSNNKMKKFVKLYQSKNPEALDILKTPDPITELEEIFSKNCVDKGKYESLCETMQFSDQTRKKLGRLVAGQREKEPGNNLSNLLNRVQLLKKILIEENEKIFNLWLKVKSQKSREYVVDTIVWYYLRDRELQAAVEMLLFDCMCIFGKRRKNLWIKSSKLYCGINMRDVLSHGSPLMESLCKLLDPEDLPSDLIKKILQLIEGEDAIEAILELYHRINEDFPKLLAILNNEEKDEHLDLKNRILKCDEWKTYILLLPYNPIRTEN